MKHKSLHLVLALGTLLAAPAYSMHYKLILVGPAPPMQFPHPPPTEFATCTSASNTIAVGIDTYASGVRVHCADAGRIGFWTSFTPSDVAGTASNTFKRATCPSGSALVGINRIQGFILPLCSLLVPNFTTGNVARSGFFTMGESGPSLGDFVCPNANEFLQGFKSVSGGDPTPICAPILTEARAVSDPQIDLAIRSFSQKTIMGRNDSETFGVDLVNLGSGTVSGAAVRVELRFNGEAWQMTPNTSGVFCTPVLSNFDAGARLRVVGTRCTVPFTAIPLNSSIGNGSMSFTLSPFGPESLRPTSPNLQQVFSVRALLLDGEDADDSNDRAAFPVFVVNGPN